MSESSIHIFVATAIEARAVGGGAVVIGPKARKLPDIQHAGAIVVAGFGGALDPTLRIGEIIIDAPEYLHLSGPWRRGRIHTADHIVATPAQKAELFRATGAIAVDMEQARVQALADRLQVPLIGVRAISDRADHVIDPQLTHCLDETGDIRSGVLIRQIFRKPAMIPRLIRLGIHSKKASRALKHAMPAIMAELTAAIRRTPQSQK
ncbi:MAG: hypothetical protein JO353_01340 [Phycisphaerae bacterium]|nr:hypothetical protein [Phycisphaerae bacterium]